MASDVRHRLRNTSARLYSQSISRIWALRSFGECSTAGSTIVRDSIQISMARRKWSSATAKRLSCATSGPGRDDSQRAGSCERCWSDRVSRALRKAAGTGTRRPATTSVSRNHRASWPSFLTRPPGVEGTSLRRADSGRSHGTTRKAKSTPRPDRDGDCGASDRACARQASRGPRCLVSEPGRRSCAAARPGRDSRVRGGAPGRQWRDWPRRPCAGSPRRQAQVTPARPETTARKNAAARPETTGLRRQGRQKHAEPPHRSSHRLAGQVAAQVGRKRRASG